MWFAEINKSCTYSTQALIELCSIRDGTIQCNILNQNEVCALIDVLSTDYDDFCMILNCISYCCIYYVCNNLVALLKLVQYVWIKKYLLYWLHCIVYNVHLLYLLLLLLLFFVCVCVVQYMCLSCSIDHASMCANKEIYNWHHNMW